MAKKDSHVQTSLDAHREISTGNKACLSGQNFGAHKRVLMLGNTTINVKSVFIGKVTLDKALGNIAAQKIKQ